MNLKRHGLTSAFCRRTDLAPKRYGDGNGLMLDVKPTGTRSWVQSIVICGKRRTFGLGAFPLVTLAEAREKALENRRIARSGGDPRQRQSSAPTFAKAARIVHEQQTRGSTNAKYAAQWLSQLEQYVFPAFGQHGVDVINRRMVVAVLEPIWTEKAKLAGDIRGRLEKVFVWAVANEYREDNPADRALLEAALGPQNRTKRGHPYVPYGQLAAAVRTIRECGRPAIEKLAVEFLILTAGRSVEIREADWQEIDLASRTWTVPARRMKARKDHRVPLANRAVTILKQARAINPKGLIFAKRGKAIGETTLNELVKGCGLKDANGTPATPHGFRKTFKTWAQDTAKPDDLSEMALAHAIPNAVKAAYAKSDLFDRRVAVMAEYAEYANPEGA